MTHENERSAEVVVVLLDIVRIIVGRLPVVHCVEVETRIFVLNGFEERFESVMEATSAQRLAT